MKLFLIRATIVDIHNVCSDVCSNGKGRSIGNYIKNFEEAAEIIRQANEAGKRLVVGKNSLDLTSGIIRYIDNINNNDTLPINQFLNISKRIMQL